MDDYHLSNGREIYLVRWSMIGTYSGVLEGSKKEASRYIRKDLPKIAARVMPPGYPLAVIGPAKGDLPRWLCVAQFESVGGVHKTEGDFNSRLYVCWFMEDFSWGLDKVIQYLIPQIDWEGLAEDYDMMNF